jgi:hypothetical protein
MRRYSSQGRSSLAMASSFLVITCGVISPVRGESQMRSIISPMKNVSRNDSWTLTAMDFLVKAIVIAPRRPLGLGDTRTVSC